MEIENVVLPTGGGWMWAPSATKTKRQENGWKLIKAKRNH